MSTSLIARTPMLLSFAAIYFIWGSTYLALAIVNASLPTLTTLGLRFVVAGVVLVGWARWRQGASAGIAQLRTAAAAGLLMLCLGVGAVAIAVTVIPSGLAAVLVATVPLWAVVVDAVWSGARLPARAVVGVVLGFAGIGLLMGTDCLGGSGRAHLGAAAAVLGGSCAWAIGSVLVKRATLPASMTLASGVQMATGGAALLVLGVLRGELGAFATLQLEALPVLAWLYLIVFGSIVAFSAYTYLLRTSTPARVTTYAYVNPVVALLLGWAFRGEPLSGRVLVAAAVIIAAVILTLTAPATRRAPCVDCSDDAQPRRSPEALDHARSAPVTPIAPEVVH